MSIEFSKKEETAKPEVVGNPEISTLETEESDKKFAEEIILKIENDTNFELSSNQEIEKIDSSVNISDFSEKEEIKKELNLEKNLNELDIETKNISEEAKNKILEIEKQTQEISTLISGKNNEEIYKIFSNEQDQSILIKSSLDIFKKRGKISQEEQKTKEALLKFIEIRPSIFEKIIQSKNPDDASNAILLYSSLVNNGSEAQQKIGMALLKKHLDLVKQITTSATTDYENKDYYNSDTNLLRRSILEKGDKDIKAEAQKWFEETINDDKFDVNTIFCLQRLYGKDKKSITNLTKTYLEKHGLPSEKLLTDWKSGKIEPHLGFASVKKIEDKIPGATKVLHEQFKISDFWRYPTEVLVDQYNNKDNMDMPYGVIIFPTADHNGAFAQNAHWINKLHNDTKGKYLLRIMEAEGKFSLARNLLSLNKKYGNNHKISFGLLGGHGSKNSIQFGSHTLNNFFSEKNLLRKKDFEGEGVKKIKSFFEENPSIALVSCSTGKEQGIGQKISETYGADISAPDRPAALYQLGISFDQNGKIKFDTKYLHSGQEMKYSRGIKK